MTRYHLLFVLACSTFAFVTLGIFLPGIHLFHILNAMLLALSVSILVAFGPGAFRLLTTPGKISPAGVLVSGITLNWLGVLLREISFYVGPEGGPEHLSADPVWLIGLWMSVTAGALLLAAWSAHEDDPFPTRNLGIVAAVIGFIVLIAGLAMWSVKVSGVSHIDGVSTSSFCHQCHD